MSDPDDAWLSLGAWVRRRRKALDLTQAALADRVGCAVVTIHKLETDALRPSPAMAARLARCLDLTPDERAVLLQVARGEYGSWRLPSPLTGVAVPPPLGAAGPPLVVRLPVDTLPPVAPLPPGSRMPLHRNPLFVGRDAELRALAQALTVGETAAIGQIAAATGLGGIGKTQLACEFVHRYGQFFPGGVCWLSFADPAAIPAEVAACGGTEGLQLGADFDTLPLEIQVRRVLVAWKEPLPRLLVFDTCEDAAVVAQWRPTHGGCRVLLTSRRQHWDAALGVQPLPLDVLPRAESLALLRHFRPDLGVDDADLDAIAALLGDLPLALHLAGSFLANYRHALTPAQYLARLHAPTLLDDRSLQAAGLSPTQHGQHVARTFAQSYARLDGAEPLDALARTLLAHAACFAPGEPLPRWLLVDTLGLPKTDAAGALLAEDALRRILDLGLLGTDAAGNLRLHRLVVAFVQVVLGDAAAQAAVEVTMLQVTDALNVQGNPRPLLAIQPHLRFLTEAALARADAHTAGLCNALGCHLWQLGVYAEAQGYHAQALAIRQRVLGPDHPETAMSLNNLGNALYLQGQYAAALRAYAQALAIRQRVLGPDHPDTASSLNNLSGVLSAQGQYAAAQRYMEQALAIRQRVLGAEHPDTANSLTNLGVTLSRQGQYTQAQHYVEQALAIYQHVLGPEHPLTARSLSSLGNALYLQGQYAQAQRSFEQALAIRERALGTHHPETALSLNNLGLVLLEQGQYTQAQHYVEQALAIYQHVLEPEHPLTACGLNDLSVVLSRQGQYAQAQRSFEQALAIHQRVLGAEHPDTVRSLTNLGEVFTAQGQYAQAQDSLDQALAIQARVLGPDHPHLAESLQSLGVLFTAQARYAEAQRSLEQSLTIRQRVLGPDHPDTARSLGALGEVLQAQGQYAEAQGYLEQALAIQARVLGPDHPDTARSLKGLGALLHAQEKATQARPYLAQALAICAQRLGPQHPDTEQTRQALAALDADPTSTERGAGG